MKIYSLFDQIEGVEETTISGQQDIAPQHVCEACLGVDGQHEPDCSFYYQGIPVELD